MRVADAVATVAGHILARLRDDLTPAQEIVLRRALTAEAERINKTAAPGWNPGAAEPNDCLESKDMTRSIPRHAREIHAGDIITRDPDHENRPVRWRASNRAEVTGDGVAIIDYVDQADGVKGIAYYGGLVTLTVEPAGGAQ